MSLFLFCLSAHVDMPHRQDLALVVTGLDRQADGQRDRTHAPMNMTSMYSSLAPTFSWLVTPTDRPTVPNAEQDSKMASMTDTASEVL